MQFPDSKNELRCFKEGYEFVIGCDEVGRGPLAGPVVAAACILKREDLTGGEKWHARVRDSKTVTEKEREILAAEIFKNALEWGIGEVASEEIDKINIHNASLLAIQRAIKNLLAKISRNTLSRSRKFVTLIDGRFQIPNLDVEQKNVVRGDSNVLSIAAASIIAKVHRDNIMKNFDQKFPKYGFAKHKGYGTKEHYRSLQKLGASPIHRRTFVN